jgi:hypothetical protein
MILSCPLCRSKPTLTVATTFAAATEGKCLPEGNPGHFGPGLRRFVLMQYYPGQSTLNTQPDGIFSDWWGWFENALRRQ